MIDNTTSNFSRHELYDLFRYHNLSDYKDNSLFVIINEPSNPSIVETLRLESPYKTHTLKEFFFWDITEPFFDSLSGEYIDPVDADTIKEIYDTLVSQKWSNINVACLMGKSRSSAIAKFCHLHLGYDWNHGLSRAKPNTLLYESLKKLRECST